MRRRLCRILILTLCLLMLQAPSGHALTPETGLTMAEKASLRSALYEADISSMRRAIDAGVLTCRELTEYYLERIQAYNAPYNCFITLSGDALEQADARDAQLETARRRAASSGFPWW